jgi:hypothetical protein
MGYPERSKEIRQRARKGRFTHVGIPMIRGHSQIEASHLFSYTCGENECKRPVFNYIGEVKKSLRLKSNTYGIEGGLGQRESSGDQSGIMDIIIRHLQNKRV